MTQTITFPPQLNNPVSTAQGGTGAVNTLSNNRILVSGSGTIVEATAITASRALVSDANGIPVHAATTSTEVGYVSGVTSALQTQINAKAATTALASMPVWTKYSVVHTALQAAAVTNDIELFSLPTKTLIHRVIIKNTIAFAGTTTYTLSVGIVGNLVKYIAVFDVMQAVANTTFGIAAATINATLENFGAATSIRLSAISTIQNLDQSSAGAVDIYVQTSLLP